MERILRNVLYLGQVSHEDEVCADEQDERPEPSLFRVGPIEISTFQHPNKKFLREIACL